MTRNLIRNSTTVVLFIINQIAAAVRSRGDLIDDDMHNVVLFFAPDGTYQQSGQIAGTVRLRVRSVRSKNSTTFVHFIIADIFIPRSLAFLRRPAMPHFMAPLTAHRLV